MTEPVTQDGITSAHRHTVIIFVRVPDCPDPIRVVGVLLQENGESFAAA